MSDPMFKRYYIPGMFAKWESCSMHILGLVLLGISIFLIPSTIIASVYGEDISVYLWPMAIGTIFSLFLILLFKMPAMIKPIDGISMLGLAWLSAIVFGATPFIFSGMAPIDAIFESCSGFTTTGATIMSNIESWPKGILFWRSMSQWIGGIAIIMIFLFLMPIIGFGGRAIFGNEMSGSGSKNFSARMKDAAIQFTSIYFILSAIMVVILIALGTPVYESFCITCSTISCGGFMCKNTSLTDYSLLIKFVVMVFMFMGGTNFYLHFKALYQRKPSAYRKNEEFTFMLIWFTIMSFVMYLLIYGGNMILGADMINDFGDVAFTVVSAATSTGFASCDFSLWPYAAVALLMFLAFIGASSGSTAGGIKVSRLIIMYRYIRNGLDTLIHPHSVYDIKFNGGSLEESAVKMAMVVILLFVLQIVIGSFILMISGIPFDESLTAVVACITTYGPGIGVYGPYGSYESVSPLIKIVLSFLMWFGRLEVITALLFFTPGFWKELVMARKKEYSKLKN